MTELVQVTLLWTATFAILNYLKRPIQERYPDIDLWWFVYVQFAVGVALSAAAGFNALPGVPGWLGTVLTAAAVGGGSELLYVIFGDGGNVGG